MDLSNLTNLVVDCETAIKKAKELKEKLCFRVLQRTRF